jgi:hypothetical protein
VKMRWGCDLNGQGAGAGSGAFGIASVDWLSGVDGPDRIVMRSMRCFEFFLLLLAHA